VDSLAGTNDNGGPRRANSNQLACFVSGSVMRNVAPRPASFSADICPP
jgi:hypothetical protein